MGGALSGTSRGALPSAFLSASGLPKGGRPADRSAQVNTNHLRGLPLLWRVGMTSRMDCWRVRVEGEGAPLGLDGLVGAVWCGGQATAALSGFGQLGWRDLLHATVRRGHAAACESRQKSVCLCLCRVALPQQGCW